MTNQGFKYKNNSNSDGLEEELKDVNFLWVEDDSALNEILRKWLTRYGANVNHADTGGKALKLIKENKPDIILLDILLPDINGFEILEKIKADEELKDIPVIIFSNLNHQEDMNRGYKLGADRYMVKSTVFLEKLPNEIKKVMEEHEQ